MNWNPDDSPLPKNSYSEKLPLSGIALDYVLDQEKFDTVLDIGSGPGEHADAFEAAGKKVFRLDYGKSRAFTDSANVIIGDFITHEFDRKFDLVWASHVLEHTIYTHEFLQKLFDVTSDSGFVAITVPPAKAEFVGGHVTLWTPALLLYRLVLAGFDCSNAKVFVYGYNISVIVPAKRNAVDLDSLAWDFNDIERLKAWFPKDIHPKIDGARYGKVFSGAHIFFR